MNFDVTEPAVGQYEYELRVTPLDGETDRENNRALTYLNVIDQQIQVLFLEGSPYWDTTFLQRSLLRNDKMNVDSIVQYARGQGARGAEEGGREGAEDPGERGGVAALRCDRARAQRGKAARRGRRCDSSRIT